MINPKRLHLTVKLGTEKDSDSQDIFVNSWKDLVSFESLHQRLDPGLIFSHSCDL